jgi:hypothetical protein
LEQLFTVAFGEDHGFHVKDVYDTEVEIINAMICQTVTKDEPGGYHLITKK